jgi:hypothetical protein
VQWQPHTGSHDPHPPTPLPAKKKSYAVVWLAAGMAVLLIVAVGLAGRSARQQAAGAGTSSSAGRTTTTTTRTTTRTTTTTTITTRPKLPPSVFRGSGDDVVSLDRPPGLKVVKFECPACTSNTVVKTNGFESLLVNEIGAYSGEKWMDIRDGSRTTSVTISATGVWTLTIGDIDMATVARGPLTGNGDNVVLFTESSSKAKITNNGARNFTVHVVSIETGVIDLAVNHIGGYEGTVPFDGPALVQISSTGTWTITPS